MSKKRYYKLLDGRQEWVIRDRINRRIEYRVGRNKSYAEKIVDLLNDFALTIDKLDEDNTALLIENRKLKEENEQLREIVNKLEEAIEKRGYDNIDEFW